MIQPTSAAIDDRIATHPQIPRRLRTVLAQLRYTHLAQLAALSDAQLAQLRGVGPHAVTLIRQAIVAPPPLVPMLVCFPNPSATRVCATSRCGRCCLLWAIESSISWSRPGSSPSAHCSQATRTPCDHDHAYPSADAEV